MKEPFLAAVPVLQKLEDAGFEAYFVGGSVRDLLLDKGIHDVDIATAATPEEVKRVFSKTVDVGIEHGTVLVLFQNESYEITTFRTEAEYQDYRRPKEVTFIRNLTEDLQRRDFTMNAIAMDKKGQL
ncbi:MAG: tRNA nucleotidyltransferase, partial [Neobacillus sp.]|nr:tRNA nucleotidyltransferase [Neobacillus sp.]